MARNDRFRKSFAKRIEKSKGKTELFVKKLLVEIDKSLVMKSPVDTGRFKSNWVLGNGVVSYDTNESTSSTPYGFYDNNNVISINSLSINGQTIYITNSLPYAARLETGYSGQAPAGMVGITLAEVNSIANRVGASLRLV